MSNVKEKIKEFKLSSLSVENRVTVFVLTAIILIAGIISYTSMPKESFPEVVTPEIYVGTPYPGNSALDIEKLITRPLEKEINTISGIDEINSTSIQGYSSIQVKFDFSITPDEALRKVKDEVDKAKADSDFPDDLPSEPNVFEMNFSELVPIMNINLSGEFSQDQLKDYAEYLQEEIEDLPQITSVDIRGYTEKEVAVNLDIHRMNAMQVSFNDVAGAISNENLTISGGEINTDNFERSIRVLGEFKNFKQIENIVVKHEKGNIVYLNDIANVTFQQKEKESYARQYTETVVMVDVMKRSGANLLEASDAINEIVEKAQNNEFPENLQVSITGDQSDQTRTQVDELANNIIFGVILVVAVLLFFLGLRNALFVGVAIPLSMFLSFFILNAMGVTLNTIVLFSLVLALGMLVDNGIVVVENIYRLMDEGYPPLKAAKAGVGEVALPIIASTATTLAAFIPLGLWPGVVGNFMQYLPITLIIVLSSSLFVALVINPVLTSKFMKINEEDVKIPTKRLIIYGVVIIVAMLIDIAGDQPEAGALNYIAGAIVSVILILTLKDYAFISKNTNRKKVIKPAIGLLIISGIFFLTGQNVSANFIGITGTFLLLNSFVIYPGTVFFQHRIIPAMENFYDSFIKYALSGKKPVAFLVGTTLTLILSIVLIVKFTPKVLFFPENEPQYLNIYIEKPIGTDIEYTNEITKDIEKKVLKVLEQYQAVNPETGEKEDFLVESVIAQVGEGTSDPMQGPQMGSTPHKARITVSFEKFQLRRGILTSDVQTEIRNSLKGYPGTKISVDKNQAGPPQGKPINIEVQGDDYLALMQETESIKSYIKDANIEGIEELKLDVEQGKPQLEVNIDRAKARRLGLSTGQIGNALRTAVYGQEVSTYKEGEDDYPINIRLKEELRNNAEVLMNQRITFRDPSTGRIVQVPISSVATAKKTSTFSAVKRKDLERIITISSNVLDGYNPTEVVNNIKRHLKDYNMSEGITYKFTGQQEEQAEEMNFLTTALVIAFFLIIMIIVMQFNSVSTPFIIGTSVLFSLIGVLLGLVIFQMDFIVIMTMIGIISLAGIVVNNAIVLIDYTNLIIDRRREELELEEDEKLPFDEVVKAIEEGGKTRLRPVLLTAITTIFGLIPLAIGLNIDFFSFFKTLDPNIYVGGDNVMFWGPISWTIIFGLTFATFLTLIIVPVMYFLLNKAKYKLSGE
jgi:multidrug efflux pump subunit AcrB